MGAFHKTDCVGLIPLMVRQACPEYIEGLTTNGINQRFLKHQEARAESQS